MPFAIVADLPLGTYHGAGQDGQPEPVPSVARLHAALLCAAGFGPRAVSTGPDCLDVRDEDLAALCWLEENPPDSVALPALRINISYPVAYRDDGTIKRSKGSASIKKLAKSPGGGTAVAGRFAWIWTEPPPPDIRRSLAKLCPDVAYLGTTESPARLRAVTGEQIEATADLDATAGMFSPAVTALARPARGRTAELMAAHQDASGRPPSAAADKAKTDEKSLSPVPRRAAVATARYRNRDRPAVQAPWPRVIVLPLDRVIGEEYRVGWAVAAHRALVRLIGYGAPPLVTGAYPPGTPRPANRLALHVLGPETPAAPVRLRDQAARPRSALLLLVPDGADAGDLEAIKRGVAGLSSVRGPGGIIARIDQAAARELPGGEFWQPPAPGRERVWETRPAAIPDTRGNQGWAFADAALLSLAFTWKDTWADRLPRTGSRGGRYYQELADAVRAAGAEVIEVQPLRTSEVDRYVHKVNEHAVVRPYRAVLRLTGVAGDRVVQAIGQSRHLGGGLLVPRDVPAAGFAAAAPGRP
jgi:CRISPR-associated protein Csb2